MSIYPSTLIKSTLFLLEKVYSENYSKTMLSGAKSNIPMVFKNGAILSAESNQDQTGKGSGNKACNQYLYIVSTHSLVWNTYLKVLKRQSEIQTGNRSRRKTEKDKIEQIQSEIAKTTGELLTTMEERFIQFIDRIPSKDCYRC